MASEDDNGREKTKKDKNVLQKHDEKTKTAKITYKCVYDHSENLTSCWLKNKTIKTNILPSYDNTGENRKHQSGVFYRYH